MRLITIITKFSLKFESYINKKLQVKFIDFFSTFLINFVSYLNIFAKFYKVLCYSKMTFDWLPMINPCIWPFSFFHLLTAPYFRIWSIILPTLKFQTTSFEISGLVALESLNTVTFICAVLTSKLINYLEILKERILLN